MSRLPSVQQLHTQLRAIDDDTLYLDDGRPRAIFEVFPDDLTLAGDEWLERATAQLTSFLLGLEFPTQLVFQLVPADLEEDARLAEAASAGRGARLAAAGRDLAALLRHLDRSAEALEPHLYVVVGLEGSVTALPRRVVEGVLHLLGFAWLLPRSLGAGGGGTDATDLLDARAERVALTLDAIAASPRRLDSAEIAAVLARCWSPDRTRRARHAQEPA